MRIGIPRAIHYFYWPGLWERFFEALGMDVLVSPATTERTVQQAALISEAEHCLPAKLLDAHVEFLLDKVDYIFVPRLLSHIKHHVSCTKLAPLPDALRFRLTGKAKLLTVDIDEERKPFVQSLVEVGLTLTRDSRKSASAAREAQAGAMPPAFVGSPCPPNRSSPGFVLLAHPYMLGDDYFVGPVVRKLQEMSVPVHLANLPEKPAASFVHWETSNRMYDFLCRMQPGEYEGIVHLSSFNCGCDSMTTEFFREVAQSKRIPYLVLMLDEHSASSGLETRLEAFVDSIRWRK
jgi:predicted nucleotide-binding protein (sugar kinase/HSP70/actin superfamily)